MYPLFNHRAGSIDNAQIGNAAWCEQFYGYSDPCWIRTYKYFVASFDIYADNLGIFSLIVAESRLYAIIISTYTWILVKKFKGTCI